ncbi:MAG: hypothetical protein ACQERC_13130 [Bacteroidota bacterium]
MKHFITYLFSIAIIVLISSACNKDEQSCQDGIWDEELEDETDCGGVCPPCDDGNDNDVPTSMVFSRFDGEPVSFLNFGMERNSDWKLTFQNDSISITLNFGDGDSLGIRPIKANGTELYYNNLSYSFDQGTVMFTEIDHENQQLSGFFEAEFLDQQNPPQPLPLENGEFENVEWQ